MEHIIVYGSQYGSARRYAEKLSEQTGIPAVSYKQVRGLSDMKTIIYMGGLYAGGVLGLAKTLRCLSAYDGVKLIIATVGLADPKEPENRENIRASLQRQLPEELFRQAEIFHLRGGIDYKNLSAGHRMIMALLYRSICKAPFEKQTEENRTFIETYGKHVDFTDFSELKAIVQAIQGETT